LPAIFLIVRKPPFPPNVPLGLLVVDAMWSCPVRTTIFDRTGASGCKIYGIVQSVPVVVGVEVAATALVDELFGRPATDPRGGFAENFS
jgi:hypothetical protein